jgi:hypothetical protein
MTGSFYELSATLVVPLHRLLLSFSLDRELSVGGAYIPTLMVISIMCGILTSALDWVIARVGLYRFLWHPSLFRVSLFACLLSVFGLAFYR